MPKQKVSKTITERFKISGGGKIIHLRGGLKHRRSKEKSSLLSRGGREKLISRADRRHLRRVLGV